MKRDRTRWPNGVFKHPTFNKETFSDIAKAKVPPVPMVRKTKKFKQAGPALREALAAAAEARKKRALRFIFGDEEQ
jgi:hypothetical protein